MFPMAQTSLMNLFVTVQFLALQRRSRIEQDQEGHVDPEQQHSYGESTNLGETRIDMPNTAPTLPTQRIRIFDFIQRITTGFLSKVQSTSDEKNMVDPQAEVHGNSCTSPVTSPQQLTNDQAEDLKKELELSNWIIGLSFGGILSTFTLTLGNQTTLIRKLPLKAYTFFIVLAMSLGVASHLFAFFHPKVPRLISIISGIRYFATGLIVLATLHASVVIFLS